MEVDGDHIARTMAKACGFRVAVAGNIGIPVLDCYDEHQYDYGF